MLEYGCDDDYDDESNDIFVWITASDSKKSRVRGVTGHYLLEEHQFEAPDAMKDAISNKVWRRFVDKMNSSKRVVAIDKPFFLIFVPWVILFCIGASFQDETWFIVSFIVLTILLFVRGFDVGRRDMKLIRQALDKSVAQMRQTFQRHGYEVSLQVEYSCAICPLFYARFRRTTMAIPQDTTNFNDSMTIIDI